MSSTSWYNKLTRSGGATGSSGITSATKPRRIVRLEKREAKKAAAEKKAE